MASPNLAENQEDLEQRDGLNLSDEDITGILKDRAEKARAWWNKELKLDEARKKAERYYLNKPYEDGELYDFQVDYRNNRILTAIETLVPMAVSQPAEPIVTEARDSDESRQLAMDLGSVLMSLYKDLFMKNKMKMIVRHLLTGKRVAVLKYRFDPNQGRRKMDGTRQGKIVVDVVRPEKIVFEIGADDPDNIPLIVEYLTATVEELLLEYPDKKDEIFKHLGIVKGVKSQLQKTVGYTENWFTYFDSEGNAQEAVAWRLEDILLGAIKNPNWNYDEYETKDDKLLSLNYLESPKKPYIIFNHLNLNKYIIDDTSLLEQAMLLQDVLNKRGRQIVENADSAEGGKVIDENKMSQDDASRLTGDHKETIMVDGDVRSAVARVAPALLPAYVLDDKRDARAEIDNLFGTNAPLRGESSGLKTLGQEIISQRANLGRLQSISDSIEEGMTKFWAGMVQLMKVFWDEDEIIRFQASTGKTHFLEWNRDKIEDGIQVEVVAGSALPKDKFAIKNETIQSIAILDPLSIAEGLDKPNPKEFAKRIVYYRFFMDKYLAEFLEGGDEGGDANAIADIQKLMEGETPEVPDEPSKEYLSTLQDFIEGDGMKQVQDEQIKQNIIEFVRAVMNKAKTGIGETVEEPEEKEAPEPPVPPSLALLPLEKINTPPPPDKVGNFLQRSVQSIRSKLKI